MAERQDVTVRGKQEVEREEATRPGRTYRPDVDIFETADRLWLWADMPGVDEKSIQVHMTGNTLTLEGQVATTQYENLEPAYAEYRVGNYLRQFTVGNDIDTSRIGARMTNGVLELQLPKAEEAKPRRIEVRVD